VSDRNGKIFCTSIASLSHISKDYRNQFGIDCRKVVVVLDIAVWQAHLLPALAIGLAAFMQGITGFGLVIIAAQ
jgi:hypothetical protein